jgi:hypothetical protein
MSALSDRLHAENDAHMAMSADIDVEIHNRSTMIDGIWALRIANEPAANNGRRQQYILNKLFYRQANSFLGIPPGCWS